MIEVVFWQSEIRVWLISCFQGWKKEKITK